MIARAERRIGPLLAGILAGRIPRLPACRLGAVIVGLRRRRHGEEGHGGQAECRRNDASRSPGGKHMGRKGCCKNRENE